MTSPLEIFFFNFGIRSNSYIMRLTQRKRKLAPRARILVSNVSLCLASSKVQNWIVQRIILDQFYTAIFHVFRVLKLKRSCVLESISTRIRTRRFLTRLHQKQENDESLSRWLACRFVCARANTRDLYLSGGATRRWWPRTRRWQGFLYYITWKRYEANVWWEKEREGRSFLLPRFEWSLASKVLEPPLWAKRLCLKQSFSTPRRPSSVIFFLSFSHSLIMIASQLVRSFAVPGITRRNDRSK